MRAEPYASAAAAAARKMAAVSSRLPYAWLFTSTIATMGQLTDCRSWSTNSRTRAASVYASQALPARRGRKESVHADRERRAETRDLISKLRVRREHGTRVSGHGSVLPVSAPNHARPRTRAGSVMASPPRRRFFPRMRSSIGSIDARYRGQQCVPGRETPVNFYGRGEHL